MRLLHSLIHLTTLAAMGFIVPFATAEETVKVRASISFDINGGVVGYREPPRERVIIIERPVIVEQPTLYVRGVVAPCVVYLKPPVAVHTVSGPAPGRKTGHHKREVRRIVGRKVVYDVVHPKEREIAVTVRAKK